MKLNKIWMGSTAFAAALLIAGASQAAEMTIDFSGHTGGSAVGSTYAADGLTFSGAYFGQCGGGCPPPNPVDGWFAYGSTFTADFATPQDDITFQSVSYSSTLAQAYNSSNQLVASATDNQGFPINDQTDVLSGPDIAYVVFSYDGGYNGPAITNLTFDASAVPEPATWASMILGLLGVGAVLRSRRKLAGATAVA